MKFKNQLSVAVLCLLLGSWTASQAQPVSAKAPAAAPALDPSTGLPVTPAPAIDPATGMPVEPQWIDPNWTDPGIVITNISYDGLPLAEVVRDLRDRFHDKFNILPLPHTYDVDWGSTIIVNLRLKNVRAAQIFDAMNLVLENDRVAARWELKRDDIGGAPRALLRILPPTPGFTVTGSMAAEPAAATAKQRMVCYVGDLLGDEKSGGMTMDQITKTILDVWPGEFGNPNGVIQFHKEAQLLVVNGTREQTAFVQQTLDALKDKVEASRPKTEAAKDIDELNTLLKSLKKLGGDTK